MGSISLSEVAVKRVIFASAPERKAELTQLWKTYQPQINFTQDKWGFSLGAGPFGLVYFDHKTMCQIWLFGFVAQKAFKMYYPFLYFSQHWKWRFHSNGLNSDEVYMKQYSEAEAVIFSISKLKNTESRENFSWPKNIPEPNGGKPSDIEGSIVFDLLCMAAGYCFLHELNHVVLQSSGSTLTSYEEELACDMYARDFLLQKIAVYSKSSGYEINKLKTKRAMAIALSSVLPLIITPKQLWAGSGTHPPISKRINALAESMILSENDYFWIYLSCLLIFVLTQKKVAISPCIVESQKSYCLQLINNLDEYLTSYSN